MEVNRFFILLLSCWTPFKIQRKDHLREDMYIHT